MKLRSLFWAILMALIPPGLAMPQVIDYLKTLGVTAIELLQTYLLVHDDWMDQDALRRGAPTAHTTLSRTFASERLGAASAVLAGDYASALAHRALVSDDLPAAGILRAVRVFAEMHEKVVLGQGMDVLSSVASSVRAPVPVETVHAYKTATYTVAGPLAMGVALAQGDERDLERVHHVGMLAGIAFQLQDDILGTFGDPSITGKDVLSDLRQGKRTSLLFELGQGPNAPTDLLARIYEMNGTTEGDLATVRDLLETSGAKERVLARIQVLVKDAWTHASMLPWSTEPMSALKQALVALTERGR